MRYKSANCLITYLIAGILKNIKTTKNCYHQWTGFNNRINESLMKVYALTSSVNTAKTLRRFTNPTMTKVRFSIYFLVRLVIRNLFIINEPRLPTRARSFSIVVLINYPCWLPSITMVSGPCLPLSFVCLFLTSFRRFYYNYCFISVCT